MRARRAAAVCAAPHLPPPRSYVFDLFLINAVVQVLVLLTSAAWYLYWVVPAFAGYKAAVFAQGFLKNRRAAAEAEAAAKEDPAELRRQQRREHKQRRARTVARR